MSFTGQPVDDILLSKVSDKVGSIRESMLDEVEFNNENPGTWVLMDGRSCSGSEYETLTGETTVPNMVIEGTFLRQAKAGRTKGSFENDQMQGHKHKTSSAYSNTSYSLYGQYSPGSNTFNHGDGVTSAYGHLTSTAYTDGSNGTPRQGNETRPKNHACNFFIKIDY